MAHPSPARRTGRRASLVAGAILALLAAGCGSTEPTPTGNSDSASGNAPGRAEAAAKVSQAKQLPEFKAGPSFDMGAQQGKRITILTSTLNVPFVANIAKGAEEAGEVVGWKTTVVDGKGNVTEWNRVVQQAVAQKVDGIITVGASPAVMKPAVAKAKAAGIPLVDALTADQDKDPLVPGTFSHVSISFYESGALQADYVIANSTADAHVLIFGDNEFPGEVTRVQGMRDEFAKLCPKCEVTVQDTQVGKLSTNLGRTTQTLLRRDPKITWVLPTYDAQALYIVPAIKAANLQDTVRVVGSDAVTSNLDLVKNNDVQVADVGEPDVWSGWAAVDMLGRALAGQEPVPPNIPLRLFDSENLAGIDTGEQQQLFGGAFRDEYKKMWGLS